jgi:hypothetical protein
MSKTLRVGLVVAVALFIGIPWSAWPSGGQAFAEPYRLGFSGQEAAGKGVEVVSVTPGSPATRLYKVGGSPQVFTLVPGDLITAVDGKPVGSLADYYGAMDAATPGKVVITVIDSTGETASWTTESKAGNPQGDHQPPPENSGQPATLYLVIVADTHAKGIGDTVEVDLATVQGLFRGYIPAPQLRVTALSGNQINPGNIQREIERQGSKGLIPGRDTLVVYYSGHGDYDQQVGDHVLTTSGGNLYLQRDVQAAARRLRPRITVLFSDACSVLITGPAAAPGFPEPPEKTAPLFASLFFDLPPGVVPISATMKGQAAGCDTNGGYFTFALRETLQSKSEERFGWSRVLKEVNRDVREVHPGVHQTAYIIGAESPDPSPRFGVTAQATRRGSRAGGVEVTLVMDGYPGTAMKRPGDDTNYFLIAGRHIITRINSERVRSYAEFVNAVRNSPREMVVTVYDPVKDTVIDYETNLRD